MRRLAMVLVPLILAVLGGLLPVGSAQAQNRLCFTEVPYCIEGRFAEYWQQNGGLPVFGFPITAASQQTVEGRTVLVQVFERNRFELRPENPRPYDVLLGRLGDDRLRQLGRPWQNEPKAATNSQPGCVYFGETQHLVCDSFLNYWRSNGLSFDGRPGFSSAESLALFGLPLTEAKIETGSDGRPYLTQWFERARLELHPEIGPTAVLLGLLGRETLAPPAPQPPAADQCNDVPDPRNGRIRPGKCIQAGTRIEVDVFGFQPNEEIGFWINTPEGLIFGTVQTLNIGPSGAVNGVPFPTDRFTPGIWSLVFEGVSSRHQSVIYFKILGGQPTPPPPANNDPLPPNQNATVTPSSGPRGTTFTFVGRGFQPGENVGVYITAPDQSVFGAPFQVAADERGVAEEVFLDTDSSFPVGVYAITFEGVSSRNKAVGYFRITQ
ncbi:MAG: hypothetical protein MUD01_01655 [Chloroflexaceae bacterium]|jgi:hypothetical protein|nr:hypothetical protein [Chloroflexaceae bacterium]